MSYFCWFFLQLSLANWNNYSFCLFSFFVCLFIWIIDANCIHHEFHVNIVASYMHRYTNYCQPVNCCDHGRRYWKLGAIVGGKICASVTFEMFRFEWNLIAFRRELLNECNILFEPSDCGALSTWGALWLCYFGCWWFFFCSTPHTQDGVRCFAAYFVFCCKQRSFDRLICIQDSRVQWPLCWYIAICNHLYLHRCVRA